MLSVLSIRDIILIEKLDLSFSSGFSVFTGETGAGKSVLLHALSFVLGQRAHSSLLREGADQGQVTAVFEISHEHPAYAFFEENGLDPTHEVILRRVLASDGRSRCFLNDQPVTLALMRLIGHLLVEIHSQHDDRVFLNLSAHRELLDSYGLHGDAVSSCAHAWRKWQEAEKDLGLYRVYLDKALQEKDYLSCALDELEKLNPVSGEEENLSVMRVDMMKAEKISSDIRTLYENLTGDNAPSRMLLSSLRHIQRKQESLPSLLEGIVVSLERVLEMLDEACSVVQISLEQMDCNPEKLEKIEERLFALRTAARKYNVSAHELHGLHAKIAQDLLCLETQQEDLAALEKKVKELSCIYHESALHLSTLRRRAAEELRSAVMKTFPSLKLETADFLVNILSESSCPKETGIDRVEFQLRTTGVSYEPIMKVASGGELSRIFLALKAALAQRVTFSLLIFDEIDTGVSGAVADSIGEKLACLANFVQVFAITHAPQVAACADTHFLVVKSSSGTSVKKMDGSSREEELARMLSGARITSEARAAAAKLLSEKRCVSVETAEVKAGP